MASPNRIDRNASSLNRLRRNMQRLTLGAAGSTIAVSSTGGIVNTSTGLAIFVDPNGALSTGATGTGVRVDNSTITIVGDNLQANITSTTLPPDVAYTDVANVFTKAQQIVVGSDPGSPADGTIWYNSTSSIQGWRIQSDGVRGGLVYKVSQATANGTSVTGTTALTATYTSITFPANFWTVGKSFRVKTLTRVVPSGGATVTLGLYWVNGSGTVNVDGTYGPAIVASSIVVEDVLITCRTIGGTGTLHASGLFIESAPQVMTVRLGNATIDTTQSGTLQMMAQWSAANGSIAQGFDFTIEVLDPI